MCVLMFSLRNLCILFSLLNNNDKDTLERIGLRSKRRIVSARIMRVCEGIEEVRYLRF